MYIVILAHLFISYHEHKSALPKNYWTFISIMILCSALEENQDIGDGPFFFIWARAYSVLFLAAFLVLKTVLCDIEHAYKDFVNGWNLRKLSGYPKK